MTESQERLKSCILELENKDVLENVHSFILGLLVQQELEKPQSNLPKNPTNPEAPSFTGGGFDFNGLWNDKIM